jgi:hypothetical protein
MSLPEKRTFERYEDDPWPVEVWLVDEGDVWKVWCMDCGIRLGTVNEGNERGAIRLTEQHERALHER